MQPIPIKHRELINTDPFFRECVRRKESICSGRITIEHAFVYGGSQISEMFNYVPLCWHHHLGDGLDKDYGRYIALTRATPEELARYPKRDWKLHLAYLKAKYEV